MINCAHCATPIPDDSKFCYSCGSQVSDAEGQAAASLSMGEQAFAQMEKLLREETAGEFEVHKLLGRGGMAAVYLATETKLGRKVAIKVLPPELTFGHGVERFLREAKTAAQLDHPNIIPVYRVASEGKLFWYAMKFLQGRSLEDVLKERGRIPLDETIRILSQVADALDYAHEHNVIHRDVKPANIMLDGRNRVIVTDFGIAKALTEGTLTAAGSVVGTPYYMSPEQGMGKGITGRADQYSVAVMAYRMLAGHVPFEGESAIDILHKHVMMQPPALHTIAPDLPGHVFRVVHRALEKQAEARFPTVSAFVSALTAPKGFPTGPDISDAATIAVSASEVTARAAQGASVKPARAPVRPPGARRSVGKVVTAALGLALVAGLAYGVWWTAQRRGTTDTVGDSQKPADTPVTRPLAGSAQTPAGTQTSPSSAVPARDSTAGANPPGPANSAPTQPGGAATTPSFGQVVVAGAPRVHRLLVDGRVHLKPRIELSPGSHQIQVVAPGYEPFTARVDLRAGERSVVAYAGRPVQPRQPLPGREGPAVITSRQPDPAGHKLAVLLVRISPWANVTLNGRSLGPQSRVVDTLVPGTHVLHFEREGFVSRDTTVTLRAGDDLRLLVQMVQRP